VFSTLVTGFANLALVLIDESLVLSDEPIGLVQLAIVLVFDTSAPNNLEPLNISLCGFYIHSGVAL